MQHKPECVWGQSECEYKNSHHYCPHEEHKSLECECFSENATPGLKWGVFECGKELHVAPTLDSHWPIDHTKSATCHCSPKVRGEHKNMLIVHEAV